MTIRDGKDWVEAAAENQVPVSSIKKLDRTLPGATFSQSLEELGINRLGTQTISFAAVQIGERIRMARQSRGMTQAELAEKIGRTQGDVSDIERGKGKDGPTFKTLQAIADVLRIELPIGSQAAIRDELVVTSIETVPSSDIVTNMVDCRLYRPLFSDGEWGSMRNFVASKVDRRSLSRPVGEKCAVLTVPASTRASLVLAAKDTVLATLRGNAVWTFHHNPYRRDKDQVVAIIEDGKVGVATSDQAVSIMFMPAAALLAFETEEGCWSGK